MVGRQTGNQDCEADGSLFAVQDNRTKSPHGAIPAEIRKLRGKNLPPQMLVVRSDAC